jgi:phosphopantetheine adenylyltransferase
MAKYRRIEEEDNGLSYAEEFEAKNPAKDSEVVEGEDTTYKKRYGDLRRHSQQLMQQKDQELVKMKAQLDQAAKGQIKFPKTDEEIEVWSKKYPDVAKIVDSIARKRANEALEEGEKRMEGLRQLETKLTKKEAEQELMKIHPDFGEIRLDESFHHWVAEQTIDTQNALYRNNTDARAASRAIDLYKYDMSKSNTKTKSKSAAHAVGRTSSSTPKAAGRASFSESQVQNMSMHEYSKHEAAIEEALSNGNFDYDISGGAR